MKVWVRNLLLVLMLAVPTVTIGLTSKGSRSPVVLAAGVLMLVAGGAIVAAIARQGRLAEREDDERQELLAFRAMRASFVLTALAIQVVWALELSGTGTGTAGINAVYYVFWFSFICAYGYYRARA